MRPEPGVSAVLAQIAPAIYKCYYLSCTSLDCVMDEDREMSCRQRKGTAPLRRGEPARLGVLIALLAALVASSPRLEATELAAMPAAISSCLVPGCDAEAFIARAIDGAGHELRVQAYNFTEGPIADALMRAGARGVDVAVLLDKIAPCQRRSAADAIRNAGIPVAIDRQVRIAHNKVVIIDRNRVIEGSFNFSRSAMKNAENTNLVVSPVRAEDYREQWERRARVSVAYVDQASSCPSKQRRTPSSG